MVNDGTISQYCKDNKCTERAKCNTFKCPANWVDRKGKSTISCAQDTCTANDRATCCQEKA